MLRLDPIPVYVVKIVFMKIELDRIPETEFEVGGKKYQYFGGTAYLGLQHDPEFKSKMAEFILDKGTHWGASRAGNVIVNRYKEIEQSLATWAGSEQALTLSSGFLAGRLLADSFSASQHRVFCSPSCHAAILPFGTERMETWEKLEQAIRSHQRVNPNSPAVLFTDTVDFQQPNKSIFERLTTFPSKGLTLIADDSHGIGIYENHRNTAYESLSKFGFDEVIVCGSLGKAMGISAGIIFGSSTILAQLEQSPLFSGASPAAPAGIETVLWAINSGLYFRKNKKLHRNVAYFKEKTKALNHLFKIKNHAVWLFWNDGLAQFLLDKNILITHFQYPAADQKSSPSRIVISAAHARHQLDMLIEALHAYQNEIA